MWSNSDESRMRRVPRIAWRFLKLTLLTGGLTPSMSALSVLLLSPVNGHCLPIFGSLIHTGVVIGLTDSTSAGMVVTCSLSGWSFLSFVALIASRLLHDVFMAGRGGK